MTTPLHVRLRPVDGHLLTVCLHCGASLPCSSNGSLAGQQAEQFVGEHAGCERVSTLRRPMSDGEAAALLARYVEREGR